MRITDQINLQGTNPLVGDHDERLKRAWTWSTL